MRFDLHCHVKGGSIDSRVSLERFIHLLKIQDFDGMMITDHDSYRACRYWDRIKNDPEYKDFVVIKGIEYDTRDAGHFLVIMPDGVYMKVLTLRGMRLERLISIVHGNGGILGAAHPYGVRSSSAMLFKYMTAHPSVINQFDFIEVFNTCESPISNALAYKMAQKYGKPGTGGTDAHDEKYVGMGYTDIDYNVRSNNDLIYAIQNGYIVNAGGLERKETTRSKLKDSPLGVLGFQIYNQGLSKLIKPYRKHQARKVDPDDGFKIR